MTAEGKTGGLTLAAEDAEDLEIISARLQDAVAKVKDLVYLPKSQRFAALFNRFRWEGEEDTRVRAGLTFARVLSAKAQNLRREAPEAVVSLLAIRFTAKGEEDPGGEVELVFAGGGALKLEVECIEAELADISGEWAALGRPAHEA
ncbi:MAG: DUF2948 family protein [Alphaproteobacteria bacterium]|nr:DUF2948 family protein [Alphaproteobacteria bacterium]MDE2012081.1 DUF2948 family protein [Alphaproteobacteria bacterium]MDE2073378.1 DUF2948 family protein [Alphaproteobacteria bacterium]